MGERPSIRAKNALLAVESRFGDEVSRQIRRHHRRRLERLGWERALDPGTGPWASGDPPPRDGNTVEVLVDGASALPAMADGIRGATSHVHIAGWYFTPEFALEREGPRSSFVTCWRRWRNARTCASWPGRALRCRSSDPRGTTCARCRTS